MFCLLNIVKLKRRGKEISGWQKFCAPNNLLKVYQGIEVMGVFSLFYKQENLFVVVKIIVGLQIYLLIGNKDSDF